MSEIRSNSALSENERSSSEIEPTIHRMTEPCPEALEFFQSLSDEDFIDVCFSDKLVTFSELGTEVGAFTISVSESIHRGEPCFRVHGLSHGTIDDVPCGTSITAFVTRRLETLEQEQYEYLKFGDYPLDRKTIIVRNDNEYLVDISIKGEEGATKSSRSYSVQDGEVVITEGSNILLMRLLAKKGTAFTEMSFLSFDSEMTLCNSSYRALHGQKESVDGHELDVVCFERTVSPSQDDPVTWRSLLTNDGHLVKRLQVGSPIFMVIVSLPEAAEAAEEEQRPVFPKKPLNWEEDMELKSKYEDRKEELIAGHSTYMRQNPDLQNLISDYLQFLLLRKPNDVLMFSADYFEAISPTRLVGGSSYSNSQKPERHPAVKSNQSIEFLSKASYAD